MSLSRRDLLAGVAFGAPLLSSAFADTATYMYDALGRVVQVTYSDGTIVVYNYDAAGNRLQVVRTDGSPFSATIQVTGTGPVNLRTLANASGYSGVTNATITFQVGSAVTISGPGGAANADGGVALDTGIWPSASHTIALTLQVSGKVYGGGGGGGTGAVGALAGRAGGDAIYVRENMTVVVNSGGQIKAGGGGGGGGGSWTRTIGEEFSTWNGGGGGGGFPNGIGAPEGDADLDVSGPGVNGTTSGGGAGGTGGASAPATRVNGAGGAGGAAATAGATGASASGSGGAGSWSQNGAAAGGQPGYAMRKNGKTVTVTNNGAISGTVG